MSKQNIISLMVNDIETASYYSIGAIVIVAAIVYYATKENAKNEKKDAIIISPDDAIKKMHEYLWTHYQKRVDKKERKSIREQTKKYGIGDGNYDHYVGFRAQVFKDSYDTVGETVRIIWNRTDNCIALFEGIANDMLIREPPKDPFYDYVPTVNEARYHKEDRMGGNTFYMGGNGDKNRDFSNPDSQRDNKNI